LTPAFHKRRHLRHWPETDAVRYCRTVVFTTFQWGLEGQRTIRSADDKVWYERHFRGVG